MLRASVASFAVCLLIGCGGQAPSEGAEFGLGAGVDPPRTVPADRLAPADVDLAPDYARRFALVSRLVEHDAVDTTRLSAAPHVLRLCGGSATVAEELDLDTFTLGFWLQPYRMSGLLLRAGDLQIMLANGYLVIKLGKALATSARPLIRAAPPAVAATLRHVQLTRANGLVALHVGGQLSALMYEQSFVFSADEVELGDTRWGLCGTVDNFELRAGARFVSSFSPPERIAVTHGHYVAYDFDGPGSDLAGHQSLTLYGEAKLVGPLPRVQ